MAADRCRHLVAGDRARRRSRELRAGPNRGFRCSCPVRRRLASCSSVWWRRVWKRATVFEGTESEMQIGELKDDDRRYFGEPRDRRRGRPRPRAVEDRVEAGRFRLSDAARLVSEGSSGDPECGQQHGSQRQLAGCGAAWPPSGRPGRLRERDPAALAGCDVSVVFINSWNAYHTSAGEIHCGTNTFRRLRDPGLWNSAGNANDQRGSDPRSSR